jgi:hypothetical protein
VWFSADPINDVRSRREQPELVSAQLREAFGDHADPQVARGFENFGAGRRAVNKYRTPVRSVRLSAHKPLSLERGDDAAHRRRAHVLEIGQLPHSPRAREHEY